MAEKERNVASDMNQVPNPTGQVNSHIPREITEGYLDKYKSDEISTSETYNDGLSIKKTNSGIEISGPLNAANVPFMQVEGLVEQVSSHRFMLINVDMVRFEEAIKNTEMCHQAKITYERSNTMERKDAGNQCATLGTPQLGRGTPGVQNDVKVDVVLKLMETQQADVLVNTTNPQLKLGEGSGVSKSLLRAAGITIQQQLNTDYPQGTTHGHLAVSGPGNLSTCKTIYHVALPRYRGSGKTLKLTQCYEYLVTVVYRILIKASSEGHQSIALPALGTGGLGYPIKNVVQLMFEAFNRFDQNQGASSVEEVFIVIAPETKIEIKQLFLAQQITHLMKTRHLRGPVKKGLFFKKRHSQDSSRDYFQSEVGDTAKLKCEIRAKFGKTLLQVIHGDTKKASDCTDTIMVPWTEGENNIADKPESQCTADKSSVPGKTFIHTYIEATTEKGMTEAIKQGLEKAVKENCFVITIPIHYIGVMAERPGDSASAIVSAIDGIKSRLYLVTVIIEADDIFIDFVTNIAGMKKLEEPVEHDMNDIVDTQWTVMHPGKIVRSKNNAAAAAYTETGNIIYMEVTSDSAQKNRAAAEEVANRVNVRLHEDPDSHKE